MEEELIYELVDSIIYNEDKIKLLTKKIESPEDNEIYKKEKHYKNALNSNIKKIDKYQNEQKINDKRFQEYINNFYIKIENIENEITSINEKLNIFEENNPNKELYKISYEKFKNIILNKKDEENLNIKKNEFNEITSKYFSLTKDMIYLEEEKNKMNEILLMMEEEKEGIEKKMIDNMSLKESFEELAKQYLKKFINENENDENLIENNNNIAKKDLLNEEITILKNEKDISGITIYYYELNIIDFHKLAKNISNQIISLINHYIKSNNNNMKSIDLFNNINKSTQPKNVNNFIDSNNELFYSFINKTKIYYNKEEISSLISILSSKIEKKFISFFVSTNNNNNNDENNSNNNNKIETIDNLFININDLILSFLKIYFPSFINKENTSNSLLFFLKSITKSLYYQKIISNDFSFLNKDYKPNNKMLKNNLNLIMKEYNKLNDEREEYLLDKNKIEEKIKYLNSNINNYVFENLSPEEQEYINLNQKLVELTDTKKKLKYNFIKYENENNYLNDKILNKIEELQSKNKLLRKNILACKEEIKLKNNQYKMEINQIKKSIKDKFNVIKGQIAVYKKKNGDNMELYNKFVDRINETLKDTEVNMGDKKEENKININNNKNEFKVNSNNNSLYNTQSTFYKSNEKNILQKSFFSPEKKDIHNYNFDYNYNDNIYFY